MVTKRGLEDKREFGQVGYRRNVVRTCVVMGVVVNGFYIVVDTAFDIGFYGVTDDDTFVGRGIETSNYDIEEVFCGFQGSYFVRDEDVLGVITDATEGNFFVLHFDEAVGDDMQLVFVAKVFESRQGVGFESCALGGIAEKEESHLFCFGVVVDAFV